jgi:hypothetical protein
MKKHSRFFGAPCRRTTPILVRALQFIVFIVAGLSYIADALFYQHLPFGRLPRRCARQAGWRMR